MRSATFFLLIRTSLLLLPVGATALPGSAVAHPAIEHQIETASAAIAASPTADRFLERAELFRIAGHCDEAGSDCAEAALRGAPIPQVELVMARVALECGDPVAAETAARTAIQGWSRPAEPSAPHERSAEAHRALAEALARQDRPAESAAAFEQAIDVAEVVTPEDVLSAAAQWEAAQQPDRALAALDDGLHRLGPLSVLQSAAVQTARAAGLTEEALRRLDLLIAAAPRPEEWLAEKGRTLQDAGRSPEAWAAFSEALTALDKLPPAHRNTPAARRLEAELRAALATATEPHS